MVNPIALAVIAVGLLMWVFAIALAVKRKWLAGIIVAVIGLGAVSFPCLVSLLLATTGP